MNLACKTSLVLLTIAIHSSFAGVILVTSSGSLSGSDTFLISAIGSDGSTAPNGVTANTTGGNAVTFTDSGSFGFSVLQQGNEWSGNFANNDLLLWTGNITTLDADAVPVTMTFGAAVGGVGTQIQPNNFGIGFTASIDVFDALNNNIGSFTENGNSTPAGDGSAIFIGVLSTSANIKSITINITSPGVDFAFNKLIFGAPATSPSVPEPSSLLLILGGAALLPVVAAKRRRHQN